MFRYVLLVAIRNPTAIAEMQKLVLPHMSRELGLSMAILQADITGLMLLAQMNHQSKCGGQWRRLAQTATEFGVEHATRDATRTYVAKQLAEAIEVHAAHAARYVCLYVQPSIVRIQLFVCGRNVAALEALVDALVERLGEAPVLQTAAAYGVHIMVALQGR